MIKVRDVQKKYANPDGGEITALWLDKLDIEAGEEVGVSGASGMGKTTLLNILCGISLPTQGSVVINDVEITKLPEAKRDLFRAQTIGYVFQMFNLIPSLTAKENVMASVVFGKKIPKQEREERCLELLNRVGLSHRVNYFPGQLSGGEQQRVSIARAMGNRPAIIIVDEPTANLDYKNRARIMGLLREISQENNSTLIIATHDQEILKSLKRVIELGQSEESEASIVIQNSAA